MTGESVSFQDRLIEEMKGAMKSGDSLKVSVIRMLRSSIKNREIEKGKDHSLSEKDVIELVSTAIKQRQEAAQQFGKGGRKDLEEKEIKEVQILKTYLPAPLAESELRKMVSEAIQESGARSSQDLGKVMKIIMPKIMGRAEGAEVNKLVKEMLGS